MGILKLIMTFIGLAKLFCLKYQLKNRQMVFVILCNLLIY